MLIQLITVGKIKEPHLLPALETYEKRLSPFCKFSLNSLPAVKLPENPSPKEIQKALATESISIQKAVKGAFLPLCIEGKLFSSEEFSELLTQKLPLSYSSVSFVIGSSFGLDEQLKSSAKWKISLSSMTFPHALAAVMLMEQIYRAFQIAQNTRYHK